MNTQQAFYILSAERPCLGQHKNLNRSQFMGSQLIRDGAKLVIVGGRYKEVPEAAFLVLDDNTQQLRDLVFRLASLYDQETVLHVDANRRASLYSSEGFLLQELGQWHEIAASAAEQMEAVTQTPDGRYWSAG